MGWVPSDEFRGDADRWVDAETFLERGENIMPILKERLGKMETDLGAKTAELEKVTANLTKFADFHKGTYKRAYAKALKEVQAQKLEAVEQGNTAMYQDAVDREEALNAEQKELDSPADGEQKPVPEFLDFKSANPWYGVDVAMTAYVDRIAPGIGQTVNNDVEYFAQLEDAARREFPHKFVGQTPASAVEGVNLGGDREIATGEGKWSDLPREAQQIYIAEFSDIPGFDKDQYAKDYFAQ
jgi:hypothetical protein